MLYPCTLLKLLIIFVLVVGLFWSIICYTTLPANRDHLTFSICSSLIFIGVCCKASLLIYSCAVRSSCFFWLMEPRSCQFVYLLNEPAPRFNDCFYCFLCFYFVDFSSSFYYSFPFEFSLFSPYPKLLSFIVYFCSFLFVIVGM